jgi:hypothetical protein
MGQTPYVSSDRDRRDAIGWNRVIGGLNPGLKKQTYAMQGDCGFYNKKVNGKRATRPHLEQGHGCIGCGWNCLNGWRSQGGIN